MYMYVFYSFAGTTQMQKMHLVSILKRKQHTVNSGKPLEKNIEK